ncbi:DUF5988 family protein [Streptomyces sp. NPDC047976]|uniref:DUF5988 family protein n=1 Tax=unclassified Streptomyces TaxID=2593676 RepID=UPI00342BC97E
MTVQSPNVILSGGPSSTAEELDRIRYVEDTTAKVKVLNGNRYEHFEPTGGTVVDPELELELLVYAYSGHTYIAE